METHSLTLPSSSAAATSTTTTTASSRPALRHHYNTYSNSHSAHERASLRRSRHSNSPLRDLAAAANIDGSSAVPPSAGYATRSSRSKKATASSDEVISSLIGTLSALSSPVKEHFDGLPTTLSGGASGNTSAAQSASTSPITAAAEFESARPADYGGGRFRGAGRDEFRSFSYSYDARDRGRDPPAEPPIVRLAKPPSNHSSRASPVLNKVESTGSLKSFIRAASRSSTSLQSGRGDTEDTGASSGNVSVASHRRDPSVDSSRDGQRPIKSLIFQSSSNRLKALEDDRRRFNIASGGAAVGMPDGSSRTSPSPRSASPSGRRRVSRHLSANTASIKEEPLILIPSRSPSLSPYLDEEGGVPTRRSSLRRNSPSDRRSSRKISPGSELAKVQAAMAEEESRTNGAKSGSSQQDPPVAVDEDPVTQTTKRIQELRKQKEIRDRESSEITAEEAKLVQSSSRSQSTSPSRASENTPNASSSTSTTKAAVSAANPVGLGVSLSGTKSTSRTPSPLPAPSRPAELTPANIRAHNKMVGGRIPDSPTVETISSDYRHALQVLDRMSTSDRSSIHGSSKAGPNKLRRKSVGGRSAAGRRAGGSSTTDRRPSDFLSALDSRSVPGSRQGSSPNALSATDLRNANGSATPAGTRLKHSTTHTGVTAGNDAADDTAADASPTIRTGPSGGNRSSLSKRLSPEPSLSRKATLSRSESKKKRWSHPDLPIKLERRGSVRVSGDANNGPGRDAGVPEERPSSSESIDQDVSNFVRAPRLSQTVKHPETGRVISFSEVGDPNGFAVFICVGMGLTRYITAFYDELATSLKLRLITPDRPGIGDSQRYPEGSGTPLNWPEDVLAICTALNISKFSLLAHSAGAIYALATALRIPQHVRGRVHLLAPWIPPSQMSQAGLPADSPSPARQLPKSQRFLRVLPTPFLRVANSGFLTATSASVTRSVVKSPQRLKRRSGGNSSGLTPDGKRESVAPDRLMASIRADDISNGTFHGINVAAGASTPDLIPPHPAVHPLETDEEIVQKKLIEAARVNLEANRAAAKAALALAEEQRSKMYESRLTMAIWDAATTHANPATDLLVCLERTQPIGFRYVDVTRSVVIHHGARDTRVPVDNVKWLGRTMRRCEVRILDGEGHGLMASAAVMGNILTEMSREWEDWTMLVEGRNQAGR